MPISRRSFCQLSAASLLAASSRRMLSQQPRIDSQGQDLHVTGTHFVWEYTGANDTFRILDGERRPVVSATLQPAVIVAPVSQTTQRIASPGQLERHEVQHDRVVFHYNGVNGNASLTVTWRFDEYGVWMLPIEYNSSATEEIVSLHYFSRPDAQQEQRPTLHAGYYVLPGVSEGSAISPILRESTRLNETIWLGRGSFSAGLHQQWGLPVHFFSGFSINDQAGQQNMLTSGRSESFTCGLADLPDGDLFLTLYQGFCTPVVEYRSDLWHHLHTPGTVTLGATMLWTIAPSYDQSITAYYQGLLRAGIIHIPERSQRRIETSLTPEFCTWGSQVDEHKDQERLDQAFLEATYASLRASGLKARLFSIDDKWEVYYGTLVHSPTRLPHFEQFLDRLRADGYRIGIWAALMRCERPADIGLTEDNMLKRPDGSAYSTQNWGGTRYFILDFTQPQVADVLRKLVKQFIRRYKPDLFKFDFGYELPPMSVAAPQDKRYCGERLMAHGLDVVIRAMREENPDLAVMYYQLSPLFLEYFDLHSTDDLFLAPGEYAFEANRRMYFSSLLGSLGVPTYGSSGYDWSSAPSIWFDSAAVGTIGSLNDFRGDERGESGNVAAIAKYNGITNVLRKATRFRAMPIGVVPEAPTFGAHARSWARYEDNRLVLIAARPAQDSAGFLLPDKSGDALIARYISTTMPVVVASRGTSDLLNDKRIGLVPYASGDVTLRRNTGSSATVIYHFFGGEHTQQEIPITRDGMTLHVDARETTTHPLEWIEINIA